MHLLRVPTRGVRMTTWNEDAPKPVFVSVRPHLRGSGSGDSPQSSEPLVMPESGPLVDRYDRIHNDLRISVTDRCNLRCVYCMPEVGMTFQPRDALLTFEEMVRVARVGSAPHGRRTTRSKESADAGPTTVGAGLR